MCLIGGAVELIAENYYSQGIMQSAMKGRSVTVPPTIVIYFFFHWIIKIFHPPAIPVIGQFFFTTKSGVGQLLGFGTDDAVLIKCFAEEEKIERRGVNTLVAQHKITGIEGYWSPPSIIRMGDIGRMQINVHNRRGIFHP